MDTVSMNSENSKTSGPHRLLLNLSGFKERLYIYWCNKSQHTLYMEKYKKAFQKKFKISFPT